MTDQLSDNERELVRTAEALIEGVRLDGTWNDDAFRSLISSLGSLSREWGRKKTHPRKRMHSDVAYFLLEVYSTLLLELRGDTRVDIVDLGMRYQEAWYDAIRRLD